MIDFPIFKLVKVVLSLLIFQELFYCCSSNKEALVCNGIYSSKRQAMVWLEEFRIKGDRIKICGGGCVVDYYGKGRIKIISDSCLIIDYSKFMDKRGFQNENIDTLKFIKNNFGIVFKDYELVDNPSALKEFKQYYFSTVKNTRLRHLGYNKRFKRKQMSKKNYD